MKVGTFLVLCNFAEPEVVDHVTEDTTLSGFVESLILILYEAIEQCQNLFSNFYRIARFVGN